MSVQWMWGWELGTTETMYTNSGWSIGGLAGRTDVASATNTFQPAVGYGGGRFCLAAAEGSFDRQGRIKTPASGPNKTGAWQRFIFHDAIKRLGNTPSSSPLNILDFISGNQTILYLGYTTAASLTVDSISLYEWNGAAFDLLGTTTTTYTSADVYHRVVVDIDGAGTGTYKVYINGVLEINALGNTGFASIDSIRFWGATVALLSPTTGFFHDHSVLWDAGNHATNALDMTTQPADLNTVTIGAKTYTFQAVLTNVDGNVYRGASAAESQQNLRYAINLGPGAGTQYAAATTLNPDVTAVPDANIGGGGGLQMDAKLVGPTPNAIILSDTLVEGWPVSPTTLGAVNPGDLDPTKDITLALGDIFIQGLSPDGDAAVGVWDTQPVAGNPLWSNVNDGSDLTNFIETTTSPDSHTLTHENRTAVYSVSATGVMTVSGVVLAGDQVAVAGTVLTAAGVTSATQFNEAAGSNELVAQSIISAFTLAGIIPATVTSATDGLGVITYTAVVPGTPGNSTTLSVPTNVGGALSVSGATLTGGTEWAPSAVHALQTVQVARGSGAITAGRTTTTIPSLGEVVSDSYPLAAAGQMVNTLREWRVANVTVDVDGIKSGFKV